MTIGARRWRSVLFAPANRLELVAKLPRSGPDAVVLDLEDAVAAGAKAAARPMARAAAAELTATPGGPGVLVRVNGPRTDWFADDVTQAAVAGLRALVVPKAESADDIARARAALAAAGCDQVEILAGIETALGVADARAVLRAPGVVACYFGAEDFVADMAGVRTDGNAEVAYARAAVALAARLAGVAALDMVVSDFGDGERFAREAAEARALGYAGKLCIHPAQVPLANAAFVPTAAEVERARRMLAAHEAAARDGIAAIAFEGQMIDEPLVRRARAVLDAAEGST